MPQYFLNTALYNGAGVESRPSLAIAPQALCIFGVPFIVMQVRSTGFAFLFGTRAPQDLLLMLPSMVKIAGVLAPCVFHIPPRVIASHALRIVGVPLDAMQVRYTGFGTLFGTRCR